MKTKILLVLLLLFHFCKYSKCKIERKINRKRRSCEFTFSYGDYEEFLTAGSLFRDCTKHFQNPNLTVKLSNYSLSAFPNGTFSNLGNLDSFTLEIMNNTKIQLLSPLLPNYYVFEHMEFHSAVIDVSDSASLSGWKMEALSFFKPAKIKEFEFNALKSKLVYLPPSFGKVANGQLTVIRILKCSLRWLGTNVFAPFINLINLELRDNFIEQFERSHLPMEAPRLISIDLGNNRLRYLPSDLFSDPKLLKLQRIFLDKNNIKILGDQMKIIFEAQSPPFLHGVLWFCSCNEILKFSEKFSRNISEEDECFKDEYNIKKMTDFIKECKRNSGNI